MIEIKATRYLTNGEVYIEYAVTFAVKDNAKWNIDVFRNIPAEDLEVPKFDDLPWRDMTEEEYEKHQEGREDSSYEGAMADYDDVDEDVYEADEDY